MAEGSGGRYAASDIAACVASGEFAVWRLPDVVLVTQDVLYPRLKVLRLIGLVGREPLKWRGMLTWIEDWARQQCYVRIEALHPPEFACLLGRDWSVYHVLSERSL